MFRKYFFLLLLTISSGISYAKSLNDWSNEDLCRWIDAVFIPEPIILEIKVRDLVCLSNPEVIEVTTIEPFASENGTLFPSSSSNKNSGNGIRFIFNYKVKL